MPKATATEVETAPADTLASQELTLHEYCVRRSNADGRVELIGGFHHSETAAGVIKDTQEAFDARFEEFTNKPV